MRGSFRNFGAGYTKEEIKDRIENPQKWQNIEQATQDTSSSKAAEITEAPKQKSRIKIPKKDIITRTGASRTIIDTSGEKFQNSPGLQHWASVKNLKTAAASYAAADNFSELQKQIDSKRKILRLTQKQRRFSAALGMAVIRKFFRPGQ